MEFLGKERSFLEDNEVCRLATVSPSGVPHVVPVNYIFHKGVFFIASDYVTKKVRNLQRSGKVALVVDTYRPNRAVLVQGEAYLLERGPEFKEAYRLFYGKFAWVRRDPWVEGEAPFIAVKTMTKVSWGL